MRRGSIGIAGLAAAFLIGAVALAGWRDDPLVEPTGPHAVESRSQTLETDRGAYPVRIWSPAAQDDPLPLVLYAPGWGNDAEDSASLMRELASHGYIAVAFDDLSKDPPMAAENAQESKDRHAGFSLDSPAAYRQSKIVADRRIEQGQAKARAILDSLLASPDFAQTVDAGRIGFVGFSFGGATGVLMAAEDERVRAVVNFDGWVFGLSGALPNVPYMLVSIPDDFPPAAWRRSAEAYQRAIYEGAFNDQQLHRGSMGRDDFVWLLAERTPHGALNDRSTQSGGKQMRAFKSAQFAVVRAFLDRYLKADGASEPEPSYVVPGLFRQVETEDLLPGTG